MSGNINALLKRYEYNINPIDLFYYLTNTPAGYTIADIDTLSGYL